MNIENAAINILKRGVELDTKKRYTEALVCYQEGLQILVDKIKGNVTHSFPNPNKFPERFKAWVNLVGYNLKTLTDYDIYKKKRVCDIHFTDEHRNRYKRLNALAMPTLYLPDKSHDITSSDVMTSGQSEAYLKFSHPTTSISLPSTSTSGKSYGVTATTQQFEAISVSHPSTNTSLLATSTSDESLYSATTDSVTMEHNYSIITRPKRKRLLKGESVESTKSYLRKKIEEYMNRAEAIKKLVLKQKEAGQFHEQVHIENNSTGHSYKTLFGRFLDEEVQYVIVEDPYIRSFHQCQNFLRLCELLVRSCDNLRHIELITTRDGKSEGDQREWFSYLQNDLIKYRVQLIVKYSDTLHDRQITLSSGWIIKIGRGLDFFKAPENKFCLGVYDMDLRQCHETTVDIVHSKNVKQSYG